MKKWYTCSPRQFYAKESFFWRDAGLLCRGLQQLGYESKVILLGPPLEGDLPDVIRASQKEMEDPQWWRDLNIDGVIFVSWALERDKPITKAIAATGMKLVLQIDGSNTHFPLFHRLEALKTFWRAERDRCSNFFIRCASFLIHTVRSIFGSLRYSWLKYPHLRYVDAVTCQTPISYEGNLNLCRLFGGENHGVNVQHVGIAVHPHYKWNPNLKKEKRIIAIGRWDDLRYKRPFLLMEVCEAIAKKHPDLEIDIFGKYTKALETCHEALPPNLRKRILLHGHQPGNILNEALQKAQVLFCPSSSESGPFVVFEGLTCGTTAVAIDSPHLPGLRWVADHHHADLTRQDSVEGYVSALNRALDKWERGEYNPAEISHFWSKKTDIKNIVQMTLDAVDSSRIDQLTE